RGRSPAGVASAGPLSTGGGAALVAFGFRRFGPPAIASWVTFPGRGRHTGRQKIGRTVSSHDIFSSNPARGGRVVRGESDIAPSAGLSPARWGEMITMARQQLIKRPKPPRQPSPPDLRTPSGRLLPY